MSDVRSQIEAGNREFMAAFAKRDAAAVAALYTDGGQLLPPNSEVVRGHEAIREFWQGAMTRGLTGATLETVDVDASGETAVEVGRYRLTAGDAEADHGKYIVVWKNVDGRWKLHRDIWNTSKGA
ncbi:MAG TPA: SgcJ/EcaC family oxidoreductase [Vicinamibacterales bacterium]|jgi:uncharacterized protein (TIGR02246 family)|nr:SgcJ/EcaC family oxidoreductase [Vicinamibacterales bacterium]